MVKKIMKKFDIVRMEESNPCDDVSTPTQSILETSATATFDALPLLSLTSAWLIKLFSSNNLLSISYCELV